MIGLDSKILLRATLQDDLVHSPTARQLLASLSGDHPGFVNIAVLVEFAWTLRTKAKFSQLQIIAVMEALLESPAYVVADRDAVNAALTRCRDDNLDLGDALIGELNRIAGCRTTFTFDVEATKSSAFTLLA
jgi:predicted nucleic-acid-binding protein